MVDVVDEIIGDEGKYSSPRRQRIDHRLRILFFEMFRSLWRKIYSVGSINTDTNDTEIQLEMVTIFSPETQIALLIEGICHFLWGTLDLLTLILKLYGWSRSSLIPTESTVAVRDIFIGIFLDNVNLIYQMLSQYFLGSIVIGVSFYEKFVNVELLSNKTNNRVLNSHSMAIPSSSSCSTMNDLPSSPIVSPGTESNKQLHPSIPYPSYGNTTAGLLTGNLASIVSTSYHTTLSILKGTAIPYIQSGWRSTILTLLAILTCASSCSIALLNCYHSKRNPSVVGSGSSSSNFWGMESKSPMDIGNILVIILGLLYSQVSIGERYATYSKHGFRGIVFSTMIGMGSLHVLWVSGAYEYGSTMMYYAIQTVIIAIAYIMIRKVTNRYIQVALIVKRYEVYEGTSLIDRMLHSELLNKATKQAIDNEHDTNERIFAGLLNPLREDIHAIRALTDEVQRRLRTSDHQQISSLSPSDESIVPSLSIHVTSIANRVNHIIRLLEDYNQRQILEIDTDIRDNSIQDHALTHEKSPPLRLYPPYTPGSFTPLVSPLEDTVHSPALASKGNNVPSNDIEPNHYSSDRSDTNGVDQRWNNVSVSTKPQYNWLLMDHDDRLESECPFEYGFERQYLRRKPHWKWWRAGPGRTSAVLSSARLQSLTDTSLMSPHTSSLLDKDVHSATNASTITHQPSSESTAGDSKGIPSVPNPTGMENNIPVRAKVESYLTPSSLTSTNKSTGNVTNFPDTVSTSASLPFPNKILSPPSALIPPLLPSSPVSSRVSPVINTVMQTAGISMHDAPTVVKGGTITDASTIFLGAAAAAEKVNSTRRSSAIAGFPVADPRTIPATLTGTIHDILPPKSSVALTSAATAAANAASTSLPVGNNQVRSEHTCNYSPSVAQVFSEHFDNATTNGTGLLNDLTTSNVSPLLQTIPAVTDNLTLVPKTAAALAVAAVSAAADSIKQNRTTEYLEEGELPFVDRSLDSKLPTGTTTDTTSTTTDSGTTVNHNLMNTTPTQPPSDNRKYAGLVARHILARGGNLDSESQGQLNTDLSTSVNTAILSYRNKFLDQNNSNLLGYEGNSEIGTIGSKPFPFSTSATSSSMNLGLHVLIVDDEVVNRKIAGRMLKTLGCTYESIEDGDVIGPALALSNKTVDVILLDVIMKRSNGLEICRSLRNQQIDIPIIAATANYSPREAAIYRAAGFTRVLQKPFDQQALGTVLVQALGIKIGQRASLGMKVTL